MATEYETARFSKANRQVERELEIAQKQETLKARNPRTRAEAAKRLGELKAGTEALLVALVDSSGIVRAAAAEALGFSAGRLVEEGNDELLDEVIDSLMAAIDDANDYVCSAAINSLGRLRAENGREQIIECLEDTNPHVVESAILALGRLGPPEIAEKLLCFLDVENEYIESATTRALALLGYRPAGLRLLSKLETALQHRGDERNEFVISSYIQAMARLQVSEAIPILTEIAQKEVGMRSKAVQALIELRADAAVPVLAGMFADPGNKLRNSLIRMMIQADYRPALPAIRPLLKDNNGQIRQAALEAVIRMQDLAAVNQVRWMCRKDTNPYIRVKAVHGLAALLGRECVPDLLPLAQDLNTYVRQSVATILGQSETLTPESFAALTHLANNDPVPEVAEAARQALSRHSDWRPEENLSAVQAPALAVPPNLVSEIPYLQAVLERWQVELGRMAASQNSATIEETDRALTHLIVLLNRSAGAQPES